MLGDLAMAATPQNQNGTLQALTNALNIFTNTVKQAAASTTPQSQPAICPPAAVVSATVSSPLNQMQESPAPQQSSTPSK